MAHTFSLTDDGTLDTVLRCDDCGAEMRYNYDPSGPGADDCPVCGADEPARERQYDAFIQECIEDAESEHECEPSEDEEPSEPEADDITTSDHATFYQNHDAVIEPIHDESGVIAAFRLRLGHFCGTQIVETDDCRVAVRAYMDRVQYWPNVWFISDHGNAHLMDLGQ